VKIINNKAMGDFEFLFFGRPYYI